MKRMTIGCLAASVGLCVLCLACGTGGKNTVSTTRTPTVAPTPTSYSLTGTLSAPECEGGYRIVGADVTVRNETGEVIATAATTIDPATTAALAQKADLEKQRSADSTEQAKLDSAHFDADLAAIKAWGAAGARGTPPARSPDSPREQEVATDIKRLSEQIAAIDTTCIVHFSTTVPVAKFYQTKVGTHDGPSYSFDELRSKNFSVELSLK